MGCCLSMEEVHRVAYLTMKGWTFIGGTWQKEGFEVEREEGLNTRCSYRRYTSEWHTLDEAYDAQMERDDG
jgi:hypothetical protein